MAVFLGFTLPDELCALRDQVRRCIREEIIPLEQRLDPDAPGIPEEEFERLAARTKAAGLWALGAPEEYVIEPGRPGFTVRTIRTIRTSSRA